MVSKLVGGVSTHSRLKAAGLEFIIVHTVYPIVSTHSRLKAAGIQSFCPDVYYWVSTHSRLKAAGILRAITASRESSFNTQPPEGGWS